MNAYEPTPRYNNDVRKLFDLRGKVALVTGASLGGLGYYSAEALAEAGADVAVSDIQSRHDDLEKTANRVKELGRRTLSLDIDIGDPKSIVIGISNIEQEFGHIDILMNNSGVMLRKPALDMDKEEWDRVININLTGTWLINREVARSMIKQGSQEGRRIINVASGYATMVGPLPESAYYASKAGIANLSRGFAMEWSKYGINVNAIAPGVFYPTNMTKSLSENPGILESMSKRSIKGRLGNPERDLKGLVVFLASDASEYITAQLIFADGGWNAW